MNFRVYHFFAMLSIVRSDVPSIGTVNNEFNMFIQDLIIKHFNSSKYIGIFHNYKGIRDINLPQLLGKLDAPVIIRDLVKPEVLLRSPKIWIPKRSTTPITSDNIIIIEDSKDLKRMLKVAISIPFFSARTNVFVILTGKVVDTELWIREIFSHLWKIYILNVGLVFYNGRVNLFTYLPWTSPHRIENLTDQGISANIFYNKLKNLHGYPVKILLAETDLDMIHVNETNSTTYLGVDGMMMSTILERYNATSRIVVPKYAALLSPCRFVYYNHTIQGLFGADARNDSIDFCPFSLRIQKSSKRPSELVVIHHNIDVQFNARPFRFDIDYRVDTAAAQRRDSYCILIPSKNKIPGVVNLLMPLEKYMWLAILLNFIAHSIIYFGLQSLDKSNKRGFCHTCLTLYRIQMNSVAPNFEKLRTFEKVYLMFWVLYGFLISAAYQSVLISFITVPFYAPPINRIKDLQGMDFSIFIQADILADMVNAIDTETSNILRPKVKLDLWNGQRKYDVNNGYLLAKSLGRYLLHRRDLMDKNERPLFHLMDECPMPLLMSYQMPRGSPFLQIIDEFTPRKSQAGLDKIWHAETKRYLGSKILKHDEWHEDHVILTTAHLQGAFYILFIGEVLGMIAFLVELYWDRKGRVMLLKYTTNTPPSRIAECSLE